MDTRKDKVFPQDGVYFKFFQELAGLGGDVQFLKNEFDTQFVYDLKNEMVFLLVHVEHCNSIERWNNCTFI
jgi:outer membrane protein assembly factor BamA